MSRPWFLVHRWPEDIPTFKIRERGLRLSPRGALDGASLGGWLALDYATRRPEHVDRMVLVCPGGVGRQKIGILFKIAIFNLLGPWGKRQLREAVLGRVDSGEVSPAMRMFGELFELIHKTTKPRVEAARL